VGRRRTSGGLSCATTNCERLGVIWLVDCQVGAASKSCRRSSVTRPACTSGQRRNTEWLQSAPPTAAPPTRSPRLCRLARLPHRLAPPRLRRRHRRGTRPPAASCPGCHAPPRQVCGKSGYVSGVPPPGVCSPATTTSGGAGGRAGGDAECLRSVPTAPPWRVRRVSVRAAPLVWRQLE